jgi:hypothetical protein
MCNSVAIEYEAHILKEWFANFHNVPEIANWEQPVLL